MEKQEIEAYKWLPQIGEWYKVTGVVHAFDKISEAKTFYKELSRYKNSAKGIFVIPENTWILITNITLGNFNDQPAYLEFLIRNDQNPDKEAHAQQIYFLTMFPPDKKFNPKDPRWTSILTHVKRA